MYDKGTQFLFDVVLTQKPKNCYDIAPLTSCNLKQQGANRNN